MMWPMRILKIYIEEQILIKYYVIKHLILLKMQNMMDMRLELLQQFKICNKKSATHKGTGINSENRCNPNKPNKISVDKGS